MSPNFPSIDNNMNLPLAVREKLAANLADPATVEGAAASATYASRPVSPTALTEADILTRPFDNRLSVYNAHAANGAIVRGGLVGSGINPRLLRIACAGDSIVRGLSPTIDYTKSWPFQVKDALKAKGYACSGDGFVLPAGYDAITDTRWVYTGDWNHSYASSGYVWGARSTGVATAQYTTVEPCTSIDVAWFNGIGGPFTVSIDGGAATTITPVGGTTIGKQTFSGLSNTTHTVLVTTTGPMVLHGLDCYSAGGFVVDNYGLSGSSTENWVTTGWNDLLPLAQRLQVSTNSQLNVTLLGVGTNDAIRDRTSSNGTSPETYEANMRSIVTAFRATSEVHLIAPARTGDYFDDASGITPYTRALYRIATDFDVRMLDLADRWVDFTTAHNLTNFISTDALHPSQAGYRDIRDGVLSLLAA